MEDILYTIVLEDGTTLSNLQLNGNNFISTKEISEDIFTGNLSDITISDGETSEVHPAMALIHLTKYGSEYWFALRDLSESELEQMQMRSDIDYIALMSDVEL